MQGWWRLRQRRTSLQGCKTWGPGTDKATRQGRAVCLPQMRPFSTWRGESLQTRENVRSILLENVYWYSPSSLPLPCKEEHFCHPAPFCLQYTLTITAIVHIIQKYFSNLPGTRGDRVFERILLPTCLPAGRYSCSRYFEIKRQKPRSEARMSTNTLFRLVLDMIYE